VTRGGWALNRSTNPRRGLGTDVSRAEGIKEKGPVLKGGNAEAQVYSRSKKKEKTLENLGGIRIPQCSASFKKKKM